MTGTPLTYVALIRAINVGGHSIIKMSDLKRLFENIGFKEVKTYIQTGNVLFKSAVIDREQIARKIEREIEAESRHKTTVFVLTPQELETAASHNPFKAKARTGEGRSHIIFLSQEPPKERVDQLLAMQGADYSFAAHKKYFYYFYPEKYAGHTRRNINFERILGEQGTARTYKVVDSLIELANKG